MIKPLAPQSTIGIIGAGQLGKMLAQSAQKFGYQVATYDPNPESCAFAVSNWHQVGSFDDEVALLDFCKKVDVLTYEFENINGELLKKIESTVSLPQGTSLLLHSQNRLKEKSWLNSIHIKTAPYWDIHSLEDLTAALLESGYPAVLKTNRFGYDGKGQMVIKSTSDLADSNLLSLVNQHCVLEGFCDFITEASIMVARDQYGRIETFPISENNHQDGILFTSQAPANFSKEVTDVITQSAHQIAEKAQLVGVLGIEFFVLNNQEVVVNELAPRPHNSGHYSIEGCNVSQFDQHILAVSGRPLAAVSSLADAYMINLLGQDLDLIPSIWHDYPEAHVHLYQKGEAKHNRKMGHITLLNESVAHKYTLTSRFDR